MKAEAFTIQIADVKIGIRPRNGNMRSFCRKYICKEEPAFTVGAEDADIEAERLRMIDYMGVGNASEEELEKLFIYRQIAESLPAYGAFLVHATAVCVDDEAYLLSGPSGAGKTTQAKLWKKEFGKRLRVINDDKPLLRFSEGGIRVYGSPWSGKEKWHNNICAPLKAVIYVNQAEENRIEPMCRTDSWEHMMNQIYRSANADNMRRTLAFIDKLIALIPLYKLHCNRDQVSALAAYTMASRNS